MAQLSFHVLDPSHQHLNHLALATRSLFQHLYPPLSCTKFFPGFVTFLSTMINTLVQGFQILINTKGTSLEAFIHELRTKSQINNLLVHLCEGLGLLVEYAGVFGFDVINLLRANWSISINRNDSQFDPPWHPS